MSSDARTDTLTGKPLLFARLAWIIFAVTLATVHIAAQIASWQQAANPVLTPSQLQGLQAMGLTPEFWGVWRFFWQIPLPLFWGGLALLVFLLRSNDRAALIMSAVMLAFGTISSIPLWKAFASGYPDWLWVVAPGAFIGNLCFQSFFCLFPNGRFVPRWSPALIIILSLVNVFSSYGFALPQEFSRLRESTGGGGIAFLIVAMMSYVGVPYYRYRWVSTLIERQQIKLVMFALAAAVVFLIITFSSLLLPSGNPDIALSPLTVFVQPLGWMISLQIIPIAMVVSILRFRLFDIDFIIRRTVIYSILTALLALVYFGIVVVLQQILRSLTGAGGELAIIISTLAIYILFNPLRSRIQNIIDGRFYRRKYDAQKVLAQFALTARDETDLDKLTQGLMDAVDKTMRPERVSVWLLESSPNRGQAR